MARLLNSFLLMLAAATDKALTAAFGPNHWVRIQMSLDLSPFSVPDPDLAVTTERQLNDLAGALDTVEVLPPEVSWAEVPLTAPAFVEEVFGPVAPVTRVESVEDAVRLAADSDYGLSLDIVTRDVMRGLEIAEQIPTGIVHVNDYPAAPTREQIADRNRVFPGAGIAPTHELAALLDRAGYRGYLSLELFIEGYGAESALEVAKRGLNAIAQAYS